MTKWLRNRAGNLEAYSGFADWLPSGFLTGIIITDELPAQTRFQDPGENNPDWAVEVRLASAPENRYEGQIVDENGAPIGLPCSFTVG